MIKNKIIKTIEADYKKALFLVLEVETYPKFVKWCISTSIHQDRKILNKNEGEFYADLQFGYKIFSYKYTSLIKYKIDDNGGSITITSNNGPFKNMLNTWLITPNKQGAIIEFDIMFELKNHLLELPAKLHLSYITNTIIKCFEDRLNTNV